MMEAAQKRQAADALKQQGNECFKRGKLSAAVEFYTQALDAFPMAALYSNRAMCFFKRSTQEGRGEWDRVESDCKASLALEKSVKAFYYLGYAHVKLANLEEAEAAFDHARRLSGGNDKAFNGRLSDAIGGLAKEKWENREVVRAARASSTIAAARVLFEKERAEAAAAAADSAPVAAAEQDDGVVDLSGEGGGGGLQLAAELEDHLQVLDAMTAEEAVRVAGRELPDYLCCRITFDLMKDPVRCRDDDDRF